jgi:SAM-dependent methyltransferase
VRTFADACRALVDAPGADHSLYTTLAPLYEALMADADDHYARQFRLARERLPPGTASVLEVGCGVGGLLPRLAGAYDDVVGLDRSTALLAFAARRTDVPLVAATFGATVGTAAEPGADDGGDATAGREAGAADTAADRAFDAVVAFECVRSAATTDGRLRAFARALYDHLRPGGTVVCDAVGDPVAVGEEAVSVFRDGGYRLERAVDVVPARTFDGVEVVADYRATEVSTGETGTATERTPVRVLDAGTIRTAFERAGLADVRVESSPGGADEGVLVVTASRPIETGDARDGPPSA